MKSKLIILIAFILFSPVHSYPVTAKSEELESTSYFPPAEQQNLPPRKNITLSIFAASGTLESYEKNLDSNGIPILVEGYTNGNGYHPSYICRYALYVASAFDSNPTTENLRKIQNTMSWIKDNRVEHNQYITWELLEDLPSFHQIAPWSSALTNAWCAGALLHGYKITNDKELETLARAALEYILMPISEGGGLYEFDNGDIWFEECPSIETPSHILNGFIYAIDILDMFNSYYESDRYQEFFDRAITSLANRIDQYDVGYGSIYDLYTRGNKLGMGYHDLHILQLYYLYLRTGDPHLLEVSQKWYAMDYQSEYELLDASGANNSLSAINDGFYWYNYKLVRLPKQFTFNFERKYELQAVNFFMYQDNNPTDSLKISFLTAAGKYADVPPTNYTVEWTGSNNSNGNITNVYTLSFKKPVETRSLKIMVEKTASNDVGVFREIGILKNMNDEYQAHWSDSKKFEEIINKRIRLSSSEHTLFAPIIAGGYELPGGVDAPGL